MYASKITPLTSAAVALVTVLTLGACGKKIDDAKTTPVTPAPMSNSSTKPLGSGGGSSTGVTESSGARVGAMGTPTKPASGPTN